MYLLPVPEPTSHHPQSAPIITLTVLRSSSLHASANVLVNLSNRSSEPVIGRRWQRLRGNALRPTSEARVGPVPHRYRSEMIHASFKTSDSCSSQDQSNRMGVRNILPDVKSWNVMSLQDREAARSVKMDLGSWRIGLLQTDSTRRCETGRGDEGCMTSTSTPANHAKLHKTPTTLNLVRFSLSRHRRGCLVCFPQLLHAHNLLSL